MHHGLHGFHEIGRKRRFTIAAKGHVAEAEKIVGNGLIPGPLAEATVVNKSERLPQFRGHDVDVEMVFTRGGIAMDLAIDAFEIAFGVGIHVDPDRQTPCAGGNHRVDEPVIEKIARTAERGFVPDRRPLLGAFLLLQMIW